MWLVLALSTVLVSLLVARAIVQAAAIDRYLAGSGPVVSEAAGMTASSAGWIIDSSFVVATAWVAVAVYAFGGSRIGRAIFAALLTASIVLGLWAAIDPRAAALGPGELIAATAHPLFATLASLAVAIISIALLVMLYRPQANRYFHEHHLKDTGRLRHPNDPTPHLPDAHHGEPVATTPSAMARPTAQTERVKETTTTTIPPLPTSHPSHEEPIAPRL